MAHEHLRDEQLLLGDSSSLFRVFAQGRELTTRVVEHFGERLHIVADVEQELRNHRNDGEFREGIDAFFEATPNTPIELPPEVALRVSDGLKFFRKWGMGDSDIGETATVYYA